MAEPTPLVTPRTAPVRRTFELPEELLTVAEVASVLKVCTATVYKMVKDGTLDAVHVVNSVRIRPSTLDEIVVALPRPERERRSARNVAADDQRS